MHSDDFFSREMLSSTEFTDFIVPTLRNYLFLDQFIKVYVKALLISYYVSHIVPHFVVYTSTP